MFAEKLHVPCSLGLQLHFWSPQNDGKQFAFCCFAQNDNDLLMFNYSTKKERFIFSIYEFLHVTSNL